MIHSRYQIRPCIHSTGIRVYSTMDRDLDLADVCHMLSQQTEFSYRVIYEAMIILEPISHNKEVTRLRIILFKDGSFIFRGISLAKDVDQWVSRIEAICGI